MTDEPYDRDLAEVYDIFYTAGKGKDYAAEAAALAELIRARRPDAASLLDVACGTGEHLRHLRGRFAEVAGVEFAEPMRDKAIAKLPGVAVYAGDMRDFALGRTFDVVLCLFSAIGYMRSVEELSAACRSMAAHLTPGGLLVVDPWYHPDAWQGGMLDHTVAVANGHTVLRLAQSQRQDRVSTITYHYLVGNPGGVRYFTNRHEMTLFTRDEYAGAIRAAGCPTVEFVPTWTDGRTRITAVKER
jgi:SAM-dependent methyltransferase